jgi:hypothetical protein
VSAMRYGDRTDRAGGPEHLLLPELSAGPRTEARHVGEEGEAGALVERFQQCMVETRVAGSAQSSASSNA